MFAMLSRRRGCLIQGSRPVPTDQLTKTVFRQATDAGRNAYWRGSGSNRILRSANAIAIRLQSNRLGCDGSLASWRQVALKGCGDMLADKASVAVLRGSYGDWCFFSICWLENLLTDCKPM